MSSAKSWLSNPHIDPKQRTLPWRSDSAEEKLSPFDVSRRYLQHLKDAFLHTVHAQGRPWDLDDGQIVVTVPASFDEVARSLTAEAAVAAGLGNVTLLEEPQAAFYAWTARAGRQWRDAVAPGDLILVCDVGGGTADFSLIAVTDVAGNLELERISVGEHILLGGDNMDLALAYMLRAKLETEGKSLDAWQFLRWCTPHRGRRSPCSKTPLWRKRRSRFRRAAPVCLPRRLPRHSTAPRSHRSSSTGFSPRPHSTICRARHVGSGCRNSGCPTRQIQ